MRARRAPLDREPTYHIPWGEGDSHLKRLTDGMVKMPPGFLAEVCWCCGGNGSYKQTYTVGCGMGTYRSSGSCEKCVGRGLLVANSAAPLSVLNQVLEAGR